MKITLIIGLILFLILGIVLFVFVNTFDFDQLKTQLIKKISTFSGRDVAWDHHDFVFSLSQGMTLNISGVKIDEDPRAAEKVSIRIQRMKWHVDIMALLKKREIVISRIWIQSPELRVIREKGVKQEATVAARKSDEHPPHAAGQVDNKENVSISDVPASPRLQQKQVRLPPIRVKSIRMTDGVFIFHDKTQSPELQIPITKINVDVKNFSLTDAFPLALDCSLWSDKENVRVKGNVLIEHSQNRAYFSDTEITSDLSLLDLSRIIKSFPQAEDLFSNDELKGNMETRINEMTAGQEGLISLSVEGEVRQARMPLKSISVPMEDIHLRYHISQQDFEIPEFTMRMGSGQVKGNLRIDDYLKTQQYFVEMDGKEISFHELIPEVFPDVKWQGKGNMRVQAALQGKETRDILRSLSGQGQLSLGEVRLQDINFLKYLLNKITIIPGLARGIETHLPENFKEQLNRKDTVFEKMELDFDADKGEVLLNKAELMSDLFSVFGKGTLDWQQNVFLETTVFIRPDFAQTMVDSAEEFDALMDEEGRLKIPMQSYQGKLSSLKIFPDMEYLAKRMIIKKGSEELKRLLDKVFNKDEYPSPGDDSTVPAEKEEKPAEQEIIESIFDTIFQ